MQNSPTKKNKRGAKTLAKTEKTGRNQNNKKKPQQGGVATHLRTQGQGEMKIPRPRMQVGQAGIIESLEREQDVFGS